MFPANVRDRLFGQVVAVPTTLWKAPGELDLDANAANATFLFEHKVQAAVYAGGVGEHDRLSVDQQKALLETTVAAARSAGQDPCLGSGLGRTVERVKALAPVLADLEIDFAMLMPPPVAEPEAQYAYYSEVIPILNEHRVGTVLYPRPENPMPVAVIERLFDAFEIPGVKLANNGLLLAYAEMVERLGRQSCAWLCGTAGWWMPSYAAVGAAAGMSSGIVNAVPEAPLQLLQQIEDGSFQPNSTYWSMVRIEQIRQREKAYIALVIKYMQELVGLHGGINGDGAALPHKVKEEVASLCRDAGWVG
jgi:dihydrodipicolinate synthase/N-acetylneuraminate lyase